MTQPSHNGRSVLICQGTGCVSSKSPDIQAALETEVGQLGLTDVEVKLTGCHGFCQQGPIVVVEPDGVFYSGVQVKDAHDIVHEHLQNDEPVERLGAVGWARPGKTAVRPETAAGRAHKYR